MLLGHLSGHLPVEVVVYGLVRGLFGRNMLPCLLEPRIVASRRMLQLFEPLLKESKTTPDDKLELDGMPFSNVSGGLTDNQI